MHKIMKKVIGLLIFTVFLVTTINVTAQTVYITKTGTKYHNDGCRYLSKSKISIDLASAIEKGYGPCSVCKPPTKATSQENAKSTPVKTEVKEQNSITSNQTKANSSSGTTSSGRTLITGPRGGTYYINKNGNKTYVKKK